MNFNKKFIFVYQVFVNDDRFQNESGTAASENNHSVAKPTDLQVGILL